MAGGWNGMSFEVPSHPTLISKVFVLPCPLSFNGINSNFFIQIHLFHFPLDLKHLFSWCFFPKNETTHLPFTFQMEVSSHVTPQNTTSTQHRRENFSASAFPCHSQSLSLCRVWTHCTPKGVNRWETTKMSCVERRKCLLILSRPPELWKKVAGLYSVCPQKQQISFGISWYDQKVGGFFY